MITRLSFHLTQDGYEVSFDDLARLVSAFKNEAEELEIDVDDVYFDHLGDLRVTLHRRLV